MPTTTFNVAASGDDGSVMRVGATYPPTGAFTSTDTEGDFAALVLKSLVAGPEYRVIVGLIRFDTSALPDGATVTGATFRWYQMAKVNSDTRNITAEWYAASNWPISDADWTSTVGTDAFAGQDLNTGVTDADNDIVLINAAANVSKTGYTGLRFHVSGGAPTSENYIAYSPFDGTFTEPRLLVTYTEVAREYKRFYGPALLTGSAADLYTVPTGKRIRVLDTHVSNPTASPVDLTVSIGTDAAGTRIYDGLSIRADSTKDDFTPYELAATEKIQGFASTAGVLNVTISGWEESV